MYEPSFNPLQFRSLSNFFYSLGITFFLNNFIALFVSILIHEKTFYLSWIISQIMGFSICLSIHLVLYLVQPEHHRQMNISVAVGLISGVVIAIGVLELFSIVPTDLFSLTQVAFLGVSFGGVISLIYALHHLLSNARSQLEQEKIKSLSHEKNTLQAELKVLQAQIEPHFLFNTLANIEGLLNSDLSKAKEMLQNLTFYLRTSLNKSRRERISLYEEMEMVRAYLELYRIRMGDRLRYQIKIATSLKEIVVPPMLIQPLVENAIIHGLEPKPEGGELVIRASSSRSGIQLEVNDTGLGLTTDNPQGLGINNVRERLTLFFGSKSQLRLEPNQPCGLRVIMKVPAEEE